MTQEGVDERVSGRLAVGQTLSEDSPVGADGPLVEQLQDSESSQGRDIPHRQGTCEIHGPVMVHGSLQLQVEHLVKETFFKS